MSARLLGLLAVLACAGCASLPSTGPSHTTVTYLSRSNPASALDSITAWAEGEEALGVERAPASLVVRDLRRGQDIVARVAVRSVGSETKVTVETEYMLAPAGSFRDLGVALLLGLSLRGEAPYAVPLGEADPCFDVEDWRSPETEERQGALGATVEDRPVVEETPPELIGGLAGVQRRVKFPPAMRRAGVVGTVLTQFVVGETGAVECAEAVSAPHPALAEAALEAVRASAFTPGTREGQAVRVRFALPISFWIR